MDSYIYFIVALLPLTAFMTVFRSDPYQAIVLRGILGAMAALVYIVLGAPDVALTEALVGTLLAVTLYAIAVRSSMVFRLGIIENGENLGEAVENFQSIADKHHLRLELLSFADTGELERALSEREIHATCVRSGEDSYRAAIRTRDLYEIARSEMNSPATSIVYTGEDKA
jgi:putative multicomponent Na+:H+ antiporter subunit B